MPRIAYVNGRYGPLSEARISIEDRAVQFADSVYEVFAVRAGRTVDLPAHLARLARSLGAIGITPPMSDAALVHILKETLRRNRLRDSILYLQVTRGAAPRDHAFPIPARRPSLIVTAKPLSWTLVDARSEAGIAVVTVPDNRWKRCDIKTVGLLPNVLAKQAAKLAGASEAWFVDTQGNVTEGASSNAWIVTQAGRVVTRPLDHAILAGITRDTILKVLKREGLVLEERPFSVTEALGSREAFITSATNIATAVIRIDGRPIGGACSGPVARGLRAAFWHCSN